MTIANLSKAQDLANKIDDVYAMDITMLQLSELKRLREDIDRFLALGVDTDDLVSPGDVLHDSTVGKQGR